jgi:hypothetical protein
MVMEAQIAASLVVIEAELAFELAVVEFDRPAQSCQPSEPFAALLFGQI